MDTLLHMQRVLPGLHVGVSPDLRIFPFIILQLVLNHGCGDFFSPFLNHLPAEVPPSNARVLALAAAAQTH